MEARFSNHVASEIGALWMLATRNIHGDTISYAFGNKTPEHQLRGEAGYQDYLFDIELDKSAGELRMCADIYSASLPAGAAWNVDAWEAQRVIMTAPADRAGFKALARAGRAMCRQARGGAQ